MIRPATPVDAAAIAAIYNHYVLHTTVTFEEAAVGDAAMAGRIAEVTAGFPWLVDEENGRVLGFAYASPWKSRCAYKFTVETTIYLDPGAVGRGRGRALYRALLDAVQALGLHSVIGGIALPNAASVALHERLGFRPVARFEQVGWKFNRWIDVGYWELLLPDRT
ncbi:MAG: arsinothricin resistance N-acetyltransferase ArsN1 family B [Opitutales bacterium]